MDQGISGRTVGLTCVQGSKAVLASTRLKLVTGSIGIDVK
jgi:hypothetical protein